MKNQYIEKTYKLVDKNSPIILGIDPVFALIPSCFMKNVKSAGDFALAVSDFCKSLIEGAAPYICGVKIQAAYFEQLSAHYFSTVKTIIDFCHQVNLPVLFDCKRGDIGTTSAAYARAYLEKEIKIPYCDFNISALDVDAVTINAYMGEDAIYPFYELAKRKGKGVFVLVQTSNSSSTFIQNNEHDQIKTSHRMASLLHEICSSEHSESISLLGAVVGATFPGQMETLRRLMPRQTFLMPGIGSQGGDPHLLKYALRPDGKGVLIPMSRSLSYFKENFENIPQYIQQVSKNLRVVAGELNQILKP